MTPARPVPLGLAELEAREVPAAAFETLPVLPTSDPATLDNARAIAALGRTLGRRTDAFLKFGDSNTLDPQYLYPLGNPASFAGVAAAHPELAGTLLAFQNPIDAAG